MKTLTLLRHAKSGDDGLISRDFDRRLNAKGRRAARAVGRYLRDGGAHFDHVLASSATRVVETVEDVAIGYGADLAPEWRRGLYLAPAEDLLEAVRGVSDTVERLLVVSHNPGLEDLVLLLVPDEPGTRRCEIEEKYPTASLAEIRFDVARWQDVAAGGGRLINFVRPRDLDPALGPGVD